MTGFSFGKALLKESASVHSHNAIINIVIVNIVLYLLHLIMMYEILIAQIKIPVFYSFFMR